MTWLGCFVFAFFLAIVSIIMTSLAFAFRLLRRFLLSWDRSFGPLRFFSFSFSFSSCMFVLFFFLSLCYAFIYSNHLTILVVFVSNNTNAFVMSV